jgi:uncharacterized protein YjiS (DUF1127 family)
MNIFSNIHFHYFPTPAIHHEVEFCTSKSSRMVKHSQEGIMARINTLGRIGTSSAPIISLARIRAAADVWRQRRALARLDPERLADLGLTEKEAHVESSRPFWDAPGHWNR